MQTVSFRTGQTILAEGEPGDTAFLIVSGSVEVSIGHGPTARTVETLKAGDVFGEMSLIDPGPRSATVRALGEPECLSPTTRPSSPRRSPTRTARSR